MVQAAAVSQEFASYEGTPEWGALERALGELTAGSTLLEVTDPHYVVGYLCRALRRGIPEKPKRSKEELQAILKAAQEEFKAATPPGRDILEEFLEERREAGARGE